MNGIRTQTAKLFLRKNMALVLLFLLALGLRLLGLINIRLAGDFANHWQIAGQIAFGSKPLLGPSASVASNFHLGPLHYYFLSIWYWIGRGNYQVAIIGWSTLHAISVIGLWTVINGWYNKKTANMVAILYATSSYFVSIGNFPWNPYLLPPLIVGALWAGQRFHKSTIYKLSFFIFIALLWQAHATGILLLPVFFYFIRAPSTRKRVFLIGLAILLVLNLPWLLYEVSCGGCQIQALAGLWNPDKVRACSLKWWLVNHGEGERCFHYIRNSLFVLRFFSKSLLGTRGIAAAISMLGLIIGFIYKIKIKHKSLWTGWLFVVWGLYMFYDANIYLHYFVVLFPLPFLFFVSAINYAEKRIGEKRSQVLFGVIVIINLFEIFLSLKTLRG